MDSGGLETLALCTALSIAACTGASNDPTPPRPEVAGLSAAPAGDEPITPLPQSVDLHPGKVALGGSLFADPILSGDGTVACTTCHMFDKGGADGRDLSTLENRKLPVRNTPTIFNVAYNYRVNWDAKFGSLEEHIDLLLMNERVMKARWPEIVRKLEQSPHAARFVAIYADGVTAANVRDVLVTYERSLITPNAPFDRFLRGERDAIGAQAKEGFRVFKSHGCVSCHQGMNVGGNLVQVMGAVRPYFDMTDSEADVGRKAVTQTDKDLHVFRVPSLRNVARTAPYFHNGRVPTLLHAVSAMARHQLGRDLTDSQTAAIVAFLETLSGDIPKGPP